MQPTTICLLVPNLGGGGAERVAVNLANSLTERNIKVHLVVFKKTGDYWDLLSRNVKIFSLESRGGRGRYAIISFIKYLRKEKPESVLAFMEHANLVAIISNILIRGKALLVISEHTTISKTKRRKIENIILRAFYPFADKIVTVSKSAADDLEKYVNHKKGQITCIYNPIVTSELSVRAREGSDHPYFKSGVPVILAVGRLTSQKNLGLLIRAFAKTKRHIKAKLLIIGEGLERGSLQNLVESLQLQEDVDLAGFQKNPYAYMSRASLVALSSNYEGLPSVLIEALACGTPVVSTDCESGPKEILDDGKYGILVPVGDEDKLAAALVECLNNLDKHRQMAVNFQREAMHKFTIDYATEKYLELLGAPHGV